jgi:hypothetical protein
MTAALSTQDSPAEAEAEDGRATEDLRVGILDLAFVDVVCSDDQLVAAEFEAIIAASWASPEPPATELDGAGPSWSPTAGPVGAGQDAPAFELATARRRGARQRSPPRDDRVAMLGREVRPSQ